MQIHTANSYLPAGTKMAPRYNPTTEMPASTDSVTLGYNGAKEVALMAGAGFVPVMGAVTNVVAMVGAGVNNKHNLTWMNLAGAGANIAGSISLAGGLLFGNSTASYVGLGLLGSSAVTAAVTTAAL
jgi:hypothetical protein